MRVADEALNTTDEMHCSGLNGSGTSYTQAVALASLAAAA
jgi:hypothetical protein